MQAENLQGLLNLKDRKTAMILKQENLSDLMVLKVLECLKGWKDS